MAVPVVAFWKEWGVLALVLLSFALQVILLITAEIRRRKDSGVLKVVVWSAYLTADTTAIYVLGHLSVTSKTSQEYQLQAFWELISQVWVELLCYAAHRCTPDSHARQLSNGGEFITIVALMLKYMKHGMLGRRGLDEDRPTSSMADIATTTSEDDV